MSSASCCSCCCSTCVACCSMSLKILLGSCSVLTKNLRGKNCGYLLLPLVWLSSIAFVETEAEDLIRKGSAAQHDNWTCREQLPPS